MNITGTTGLMEAQKEALRTLGAIEDPPIINESLGDSSAMDVYTSINIGIVPGDSNEPIAREYSSDTAKSTTQSQMKPTSHHVFLSYRHDDTDTMRVVLDELTANGLTTWTDEHLSPGTPSWRRSVQIAIENAKVLVVILSPVARDSMWVEEEVAYAEAHGKRTCPVLARGEPGSAFPLGLIGSQWIDLRAKTKHKSNLKKLADAIKEYLANNR
jgi:hypothetical protein